MAHFIFHQAKLKQNIQYLRTIFTEKNLNFNIFYSVKTNFSKEVLAVIDESNANFEIVSPFEWEMVKEFKPKTLVLNGPSKSKELVESIINSGVEQLYFNVDNDTDLLILKNVDEKIVKKLKIGIRVYLNKEGIWNRFGFEIGSELLENIIQELGDNIKGFHFHFSTNNFRVENYKCILLELKNIIIKYNLNIEYLDIGGGLPGREETVYEKSINQLPQIIIDIFNGKNILINPINPQHCWGVRLKAKRMLKASGRTALASNKYAYEQKGKYDKKTITLFL